VSEARSKISIVIPCHNEAAIIGETLVKILQTTSELDYRFELIFVDDGSDDQTLEILLNEKSRTRGVEFVILELSRDFGKEAAMTAGLDAATGDACVFLDADLQDPPSLLGELIARWKDGFEVVAVRRLERKSDSFLKRSTASLFYKFNNLVTDRPIPENVGDTRLIDQSVVHALRQLPENRRFMKGLFSWVGFRTTFVATKRIPRNNSDTKFSSWKLMNLGLEGITSFSTSLLRIWTILGIIISIYAFSHGAYILVRTLVHGVDLPGYASLMVVVLFLGGIQMVGFGLIGEYVGRIYHEAKRRPIYILRRRYDGPARD
jgi:polyisoprenyl-phosphate glycosyltransferase